MKELLFPLTYIQVSYSTKHLYCLFTAGIQISLLYMILMGRLVVAYDIYASTKLVTNKVGIHKFWWCITLSAIFSLAMGMTPVLVSHVFLEQPVDVTNFCSHFLPVCNQFSLSLTTLAIIFIYIFCSLGELFTLSKVLMQVCQSARTINSAGGRIHSTGSSVKNAIIKKIICSIISIAALTPGICLIILNLHGCVFIFDSLDIKFMLFVIPFLPSLLNPIIIIMQ